MTSRITYGSALKASVKQSVLPIILRPSGAIVGVYQITPTTFSGTPTSFDVLVGGVTQHIPLTTVTPPDHYANYEFDNIKNAASQQYVAAAYDDGQQVSLRPWLGFPNYMPNDATGFYHWYIAPTGGLQERRAYGMLLDGLIQSIWAGAAPAANTPTVNNPDATMEWEAKVGLESLGDECPYFDFNWRTLFETTYKSTYNTTAPVATRIDIVSNPVEGYFKAVVLPTQSFDGEAPAFNGMRILVLEEPVAGTYTFTFNIIVDGGASTPATLALTVA